jgi:hypothetical protein
MKQGSADRPPPALHHDRLQAWEADGSAFLREGTKHDFWGRRSDLKRFVRQCLHSETQFHLVCTLADHPKRTFSLEELAACVSASPSELGEAIMALEREGIAATRTQGRSLAASLGKSPVVRDMAKRLAHLSRQDEIRSVLLQMIGQ